MGASICLITGASDGLGLEAARQLAHQGLELLLVGRDKAKLEERRQKISQETGNQQITILVADLSSQKQIRQLSEEIHRRFSRIDILINNAGGVFSSFSLTEEGFEKTIAINHFSYFLLTLLLLDLLKQSPQARIINVASNSHFKGKIDFESFTANRGYHLLKAYAQSKLANLLFTYELARRTKGTRITVNAISPGRVRTGIGTKNQPWYVSFVWTLLIRIRSISAADSARVYVYLATHEDVASVTGTYFNQYLTIIPSSKLSRNQTLGHQLWQQSEKWCGANFPSI